MSHDIKHGRLSRGASSWRQRNNAVDLAAGWPSLTLCAWLQLVWRCLTPQPQGLFSSISNVCLLWSSPMQQRSKNVSFLQICLLVSFSPRASWQHTLQRSTPGTKMQAWFLKPLQSVWQSCTLIPTGKTALWPQHHIRAVHTFFYNKYVPCSSPGEKTRDELHVRQSVTTDTCTYSVSHAHWVTPAFGTAMNQTFVVP